MDSTLPRPVVRFSGEVWINGFPHGRCGWCGNPVLTVHRDDYVEGQELPVYDTLVGIVFHEVCYELAVKETRKQVQ